MIISTFKKSLKRRLDVNHDWLAEISNCALDIVGMYELKVIRNVC